MPAVKRDSTQAKAAEAARETLTVQDALKGIPLPGVTTLSPGLVLGVVAKPAQIGENGEPAVVTESAFRPLANAGSGISEVLQKVNTLDQRLEGISSNWSLVREAIHSLQETVVRMESLLDQRTGEVREAALKTLGMVEKLQQTMHDTLTAAPSSSPVAGASGRKRGRPSNAEIAARKLREQAEQPAVVAIVSIPEPPAAKSVADYPHHAEAMLAWLMEQGRADANAAAEFLAAELHRDGVDLSPQAILSWLQSLGRIDEKGYTII